MGYVVDITPGKAKEIDPKDLDQRLKDGCEQALDIGINIYVCGRHGCGKTSVLKYFISVLPERLHIDKDEILYFKADEFVESVIEGVQKNTLEDLRYKCDRAKVVIVDDLDRLAYKESTQCELMRMIEKDKFVILAGSNRVENLCLHENVEGKIKNYTIMEISENLENVPDKLTFEDIENNWKEVLHQVKEQYEIPEKSYDTWLESLKVESVSNGVAHLRYDGDHTSCIYIMKKYGFIISDIVRELTGRNIKIEVSNYD